MKFSVETTLLLLLSSIADSHTIPKRQSTDLVDTTITSPPKLSLWQALEKRRGGGGRGGGVSSGSGGGSGGRTGSGSRGGSSGGSRGDSTSPSSNRGGTSRSGSGRAPSYGGGAYYAGGASTPYTAGSRTPGGLAPFLLPAAALAFLPGAALAYGAYAYPYGHHYNYTDPDSHKEESLPVVCICEQYMECGCDDNNNSTFYESLFNGTVPKNGTNVWIADVNGTQKIYVNGSLPNGTTVAEENAATVQMVQTSGYWVMAAIVLSAVYAL